MTMLLSKSNVCSNFMKKMILFCAEHCCLSDGRLKMIFWWRSHPEDRTLLRSTFLTVGTFRITVFVLWRLTVAVWLNTRRTAVNSSVMCRSAPSPSTALFCKKFMLETRTNSQIKLLNWWADVIFSLLVYSHLWLYIRSVLITINSWAELVFFVFCAVGRALQRPAGRSFWTVL